MIIWELLIPSVICQAVIDKLTKSTKYKNLPSVDLL